MDNGQQLDFTTKEGNEVIMERGLMGLGICGEMKGSCSEY